MAVLHKVRSFALMGLTLATALFLVTGPATPQTTEPSRSKFFMPWEAPNFPGNAETVRPTQPPPAVINAAPVSHRVAAAAVPQPAGPENADRVVPMAHVAEGALVWIDGNPTTATGVERLYRSPALEPGKEFHYAVRVAWAEDGHWVSKEISIPVKAGEEHCVFLQRAVKPTEQDAEAETNPAKLSSEDRKLAERRSSASWRATRGSGRWACR